MKINKLIYTDIPKFISAITYFGKKKTIYSRGITFDIIIENFITKFRARTFNHKEPDTLNWIDEHMRPDDCFFDIGANIGIFSLYAFKKIKQKYFYDHKKFTVVSFEPEYSNLDQLKKNIILNKASENIITYALALGNKTYLSYLHIQDLTPGSALHTESNKNISNTVSGKNILFKEGIACYKLDDFVESTGLFPTVIKIDVDGNEIEIIEGATKTIKNKKLKSIILEIDEGSNYKKLTKYLKAAKFKFKSKLNSNEIWSK